MGSQFWIDAAVNSVLIVAGVSVLSLVVAVPAAWLLERTDLPGAAALHRVFTMSYALPSYLLAIAWVSLANPSVGWINVLGERLFGVERVIDIYQLGGVIFIEASVLMTILFFGFWSGLKQMDPALEEAARLAGATPLQVFAKVTAPLLKGNLAAGTIAVGLASLASFGVPAIIGTPAREYVLTTAIYAKLQEGSAEAFDEALVIALELAAVTLVLVVLAGFWSRRSVGLVAGRASRPAVVELGPWRYPAAAALYAVWGGMVALPLAALVASSFFAEPGVLAWDNLTLRSWRYVLFDLGELHTALANSLLTALAAAVAVVAVALVASIAQWQGRHQAKRRPALAGRLTENGALFCYSLPGTVLALLLIIAFRPLRLTDTLTLLVVAYAVKYLALGLQAVRPSTFLVHPSLLEAAQLAGAGYLSRIARIWLPLLAPPLFAAALLVFLPAFSELTMSILLYGPGTETLGVVLFNLQEYADRSSAAVVGSLLLIVVIVIRVVSRRLEGGR